MALFFCNICVTQRLEKERESKEEADRLEVERQAKMKRDEEEKSERKRVSEHLVLVSAPLTVQNITRCTYDIL